MSQTPFLLKPLTQVNTTTLGQQFGGEIAPLPDGGYFVVWIDRSGVHHEGSIIVGQQFNSAGEPVGGEIAFTDFLQLGENWSATSPAIAALPDGSIFTAYTVFDEAGEIAIVFEHPQGDEFDGFPNALDPAITTFANGSSILAYTLEGGDETTIAAFRLDADANNSAAFFIHDEPDDAGHVALATLSNGNWVAVFEDEFFGNPNDIDVRFRIFTPDTLDPVTPPLFISGASQTANETEPDIAALAGGGFVVVWTDAGSDAGDIHASIFTNEGAAASGDILVHGTAPGLQSTATVVALLDGGFIVTWDDYRTDSVRAQRFDAAGNPIGDQYQVMATTGNSDVARLEDGRIVYVLDQTAGEGDDNVLHSIWNPLGTGTVAELGDVLWQHTSGAVATGVRELGVAPAGFEIQGIGDFNGDGGSDIVWRNDATVVTWELENGEFAAEHTQPDAPHTWQVAGTGDFDGDGDDDILWVHQEGAVTIWEMEDGNYETNHNLPDAAITWEVAGTGDFDGDGDDDIVWRHQEGAVTIWEMEDNAYVANHNLVGESKPGAPCRRSRPAHCRAKEKAWQSEFQRPAAPGIRLGAPRRLQTAVRLRITRRRFEKVRRSQGGLRRRGEGISAPPPPSLMRGRILNQTRASYILVRTYRGSVDGPAGRLNAGRHDMTVTGPDDYEFVR